MRAHHASGREKTVKSGTVCPKPLAGGGWGEVEVGGSASGLSQIHTVIQMAKGSRLFQKQVHYPNMSGVKHSGFFVPNRKICDTKQIWTECRDIFPVIVTSAIAGGAD